MSEPIHITDNCLSYNGRSLTEQEVNDLHKLAEPTIQSLSETESGSMLIFPQDLETNGDEIGNQHIIQFVNGNIQTGNIMGFIGINGTRLRIHSRFDKPETDYFLHYMLQKVFAVNL